MVWLLISINTDNETNENTRPAFHQSLALWPRPCCRRRLRNRQSDRRNRQTVRLQEGVKPAKWPTTIWTSRTDRRMQMDRRHTVA